MAKKLPNLSNLTTPILVVILIAAAFTIGMFWQKVQVLEKGTGTQTTTGATRTPAPAPTVLSSEKFSELVKDAVFVAGNKDAKVRLVEFTDFECPFCGRFFTDTFGQIEKEYLTNGKIAYYIRHFPLYSIHPNAENAGLAAECAREQNKFKEMHDMIFQNQRAISVQDLKGYAAKLGLKTDQFNSCLDDKKYKANIDRDVKLGNEVGVSGTPTFYLNGRVINGAQPFANFKAAIDEELR